ncbi:MAG: tryptophan--tRNA ligase [Planctomycetota bacterium]
MKQGRILSGMRPTGRLHIGHLVGALANWAALQDDYDCFYMVADWHALMSEYEDSSRIAANTREMVADWIGAGLDPKRSTIFVQSQVAQHAELHLIFSCIIPLGWLERCPTYKEALVQVTDRDIHNYAFLGYPCLQAADILLYLADVVPVGEDQLPHLELTREVARRFNHLFAEVFPEPKAKLTRSARLLGLDRRKMSKSYGNTIDLADEPEAIRSKVLSMITDPARVRRSDPGHPEVCNVHDYYQAFAPEVVLSVAEECRSAKRGCVECKQELAGILERALAPIREKRNEVLSKASTIDGILEEGRAKAAAQADTTMSLVHKAIRF